jgi:hypothetical protein
MQQGKSKLLMRMRRVIHPYKRAWFSCRIRGVAKSPWIDDIFRPFFGKGRPSHQSWPHQTYCHWRHSVIHEVIRTVLLHRCGVNTCIDTAVLPASRPEKLFQYLYCIRAKKSRKLLPV